ncbi:hypothetical protein BDW59DRAFT_91513 [Aspergillus cavernicola]|uniref:Uncharacterized protein n=1 Tax=Aspergillus cavernicola TaxID=176166 RepID=A0ABR4I7L2_9EURO
MCSSSRRPGAIADSNSNANANASGELSPSDSEDAVVPQPVGMADEADGVIGVSMGYVQSRLKARSTSAEERTHFMERNGGYFDDPEALFALGITEEPELLAEEKDNEDSLKLSVPKEGGRSSFTRSLLKSTLPLRPRAWSGDSYTSSRLGLKKFFPSLHLRSGSLTLRRSHSLSSRTNLDQEAGSAASRSPRQSVSKPNSSASNDAPAEDPIGELKPLQAPSAKTHGRHSFVRSNSAVRRSSSDQSLYLRASSTASSLEHRPQYEHIHSQVNSRFKAIKDTLQDSSSRLLSMPTLHLQDLRSDWGYKQFLSDAGHRRTDTNATDETSASVTMAVPPFETTRANPEDPPPSPLPPTRSPRSSVAATYPILYEAMSELTGDVVVMGGYRGSILRSAKPPQRQLWVPMKVGLNLRKVDLEVGLTREDEERMEETIIPDGVLSHIGPVDICRRLLKRLRKCENALRGDLRVHNYGYDWRLSPHLLSERLIRCLEGLPCNAPGVPPHKRGAYVIAHSLGGLIARHAVNLRPELFAGVLYAGVPQHCVNILGPLRNGDDVLLSSRVLTAQVNFTFRTSFALLPERGHCFIDKRTKEEYRVDFFDAKNWDEYRLSPCINPALPVPSASRTGSLNNIPIRKRFSTMLSSSSADDFDLDTITNTTDNSTASSSTNSANTASANANGSTTTTDRYSGIINPTKAFKPSSLIPTGEGLVGPTTNPKGSTTTSPTTQPITLSPGAAKAYLQRTLAEISLFKSQTQHNSTLQDSNSYPPFAVLYSKSVPTVYGARVASRERIKYADAYDDLAFAAGDGVCLASAAMLPPGYRVIRDGLVKSDRGHVGLLGDLEGVGVCLRSLVRGRREGVGVPTSSSTSPSGS